ncbi:AAA family ATPase [Actinoplanes sp. NPDC049265]|uniref:AAA family ATPase n=1 Tax=Actinoplanes sp. NPDC049265 TaxID=3363902 RepID=UPI00371EE7F8
MLRLSSAAARRAGDFSLGMQQRLGIATALLGDPGVLVLDEQLNGLDPEGIRWMRTLMRDLAAQGRTILFSSHLMSELELTADDVIVVGQGRLIARPPCTSSSRTTPHKPSPSAPPHRTPWPAPSPAAASCSPPSPTRRCWSPAPTAPPSAKSQPPKASPSTNSPPPPAWPPSSALCYSSPPFGPSLPGILGDLFGRLGPITAGQTSYAVVPVDGTVTPASGLIIRTLAAAAVTLAGQAVFRFRDV